MILVQALVFLAFGFIILVKGADFLVEGASTLAKRFNVSDMVIGLTIVSFGTSLPELVVNLDAAFKGSNDMILGNIIGSNIYNTCLILGASGIIYPLVVSKTTMQKEFPFSVAIVIILFLLANDVLLGNSANLLSHQDGMILLCLFALFFLYIAYNVKTSNKTQADPEDQVDDAHSPRVLKSISLILVGGTGLYFGGSLIVTNAKIIAEMAQLSERVIGLTVVAIGTSLPELMTSVVAALKKNSDIAIGNVVGSNIFNILLVLGVSASVSPKTIQYDIASNFDLYFLLFATVLLFSFLFTGTKATEKEGSKFYLIDKWQAAILLMIVMGYTVFVLVG